MSNMAAIHPNRTASYNAIHDKVDMTTIILTLCIVLNC